MEQCPFCPLVFNTVGEWYSHYQVDHHGQVCASCGNIYCQCNVQQYGVMPNYQNYQPSITFPQQPMAEPMQFGNLDPSWFDAQGNFIPQDGLGGWNGEQQQEVIFYFILYSLSLIFITDNLFYL